MKTKFKIFLIISSIVFILELIVLVKLLFFRSYDYTTIDLTGIEKVMIVAHPDDETIWGGAHLLEDNYLVVCITCGENRKRTEEFKKVMKESKNKYIMLNYPDRIKGRRDNWQTSKPLIIEDIEKILSLKEFDLIVTHNPKGEYGHVHHIITSSIVTYLSPKEKLIYFGKYYTKKKSESNLLPKISDELLEEKLKLISIYKTQGFIENAFVQMFPYENWVSYKEWN